MHWFKTHHGFVADKKFALVAHKLQIPKAFVIAIAVDLLEYASSNHPRGNIEGYDPEEAALALGIEEVTVRNALRSLQERYFHNSVTITNWAHYQASNDRTNSERQQRYRDRKKQKLSEGVTERNALRNTEERREEYSLEDTTLRSVSSSSLAENDSGDRFPPPPPPSKRSRPKREKKIDIVFDADKKEFQNLGEDRIEQWRKAFPAINIEQQLQKMIAWLNANPENRKTRYEKFIVTWLSKEQDKAPRLSKQRTNGAIPPQEADMSEAERNAYIAKLKRETYGPDPDEEPEAYREWRKQFNREIF